MNRSLKKSILLIACTHICFIAAYVFSLQKKDDFVNIAEKFQHTFQIKEKHAKKELNELASKSKKWTYEQLFSEKPNYYKQLLEQEGLVFLIFENNNLRFWSDNTVVVDAYFPNNNFNNKIVRLPNGWFGIEKITLGSKKLIALILIKREYAYQNKYLINEFRKEFNIDNEIQLINKEADFKNTAVAQTQHADIYEMKGSYLCTLTFPNTNNKASYFFYLSILLYLAGAVSFIWLIQQVLSLYRNKIGKTGSILILFLVLFAIRHFTILNDIPHLLYSTKLFSPELFGDATFIWLYSLGDLLLNSILILYLTFYAYTHIQTFCLYRRGKSIQTFFVLFVLFMLSAIINYVFEGLIINSNIPYSINDLFTLNIYTYIAICIVGMLFISYFLLLDKTIDILLACNLQTKSLLITSLTAASLFVFISHLIGTVDLLLIVWPLLLFSIIVWLKSSKREYTFSVIVLLLFIYSFFSVHQLYKYAGTKEHDNREIIAQKLLAEQDPLAEHLFFEAQESIQKDTLLFNLLLRSNPAYTSNSPHLSEKQKIFNTRLLSKYFGGYWERYNIKATVFDTLCMPLLQTTYPMYLFDEQIALQGTPTTSNHLFSLKNSSGKISYIAHIPIRNKFCSANLYLEFDSRMIAEEVGFPELMLDRKLGLAHDLFDYSYAKYKNQELTSYHGKYPFSFNPTTFLVGDTATTYPNTRFCLTDAYSHLIYKANPESLIVVSKKEEGWIARVTTFSYLFSYFSLLLFLFGVIYFLTVKKNLHLNSFRIKMQFVLVCMVLFTLLFFGAGTIYYIQQQYEKQIQQSVREKLLSALVNGTQAMGEETQLLFTKTDYYSYILKRMSNVFLTDISLYDLNGNLMGSSQMKLFDEGLLSKKIAPNSYYHLAIKKNVEFIHTEKIGALEYLSAYCTFRNKEGKAIGFLNIPYFSRQTELEKEIAAILSALINVYVFLFVISILIALVLSEYFTKPLKLIQEKFSKMKLDAPNELIEWKSNDEIGGLVNEYNRMINELQKSADLLAKSERETAWREMAKQVAHEIKNPLTPMKLSIQHLQKTWLNKADDMDKKIERISQTLIEQIDTLASIANEFSNFAKMPGGTYEKIDLKTVLESSIEIFKDSTSISFSFDKLMHEAFIYADKDQLIRVFNNLFKNAVQAIPIEINGRIDIGLVKKNTHWVVSVKDNGTGITKEAQNKIFSPNFTTKTTGMGLGLAMVKNIIETFGGKIWFETKQGNGTTFFISLPLYTS